MLAMADFELAKIPVQKNMSVWSNERERKREMEMNANASQMRLTRPHHV
jgi:hypothetical protein